MSLPYLPGIGDTLSQVGPQLGQSLAHIINPHAKDQELIRQLLIQKPDLMDEYIDREKLNPGFARSVGGKQFEQQVTGKDTSESFKIGKKKEQVSLASDEQSLANSKLNATRLQQLIDQRDSQMKLISEISDPETRQRMKEHLDLGTTTDEIQNLRNNLAFDNLKLSNIEAAKRLTTPFDPRRMLGEVKDKAGKVLPQYTPKESAAYMGDTPEGSVAKMQFQEYMADKRMQNAWDMQVGREDFMMNKAKSQEQKTKTEEARKIMNDMDRSIISISKMKKDDERAAAIEVFNTRAAQATDKYGIPFMQAKWVKPEGFFGGLFESGKLKVQRIDENGVGDYTPQLESLQGGVGKVKAAMSGKVDEEGIIDAISSGKATEDDLDQLVGAGKMSEEVSKRIKIRLKRIKKVN